MRKFGQRIRQSARAYVVYRQDRIRVGELPAAVDDFLRAALHFGVAALHRIEIQVLGICAGGHARSGAAAHADQHARAAELNQQRALGQPQLERIACGDTAHAARDHDWFVIAAQLAAGLDLEAAKVTREIGAAEFVIERRGADRAFEHDVQGRGDSAWFSDPGFRPALCAPLALRERGWG